MGVELKSLIPNEKTQLNKFSSKIVAIDAYNAIYQFLTTIRGPDGNQLTDSKGRITSHISGLFYRNVNFLSIGIKPIYVFDGKPLEMKSTEIKKRQILKSRATLNYEKAKLNFNIGNMKKFAQQSTSIKDSMIVDSKHILQLLGIPYLQAPSDGEATAAHLTLTDQAYAVASQDFDSILFGAKRLIRNFTLSGKRKIPNKKSYVEIEPEIIETNKILTQYNLTRRQLVDVGILIGTDFNPNSFHGIGPKKALKLMQKHSKLENIPEIEGELQKIKFNDIRKIFLEPNVTNISEIKFNEIDYKKIEEYLVNERDFSMERIKSSLNKLKAVTDRKKQSLEKWFT
ncbi:MAG: flap endonuclease-1 [Thaumarchaeota archaeon]|nr:flap endonuclease-1 [Nitrososphaerota archaeon]MCY3975676.1 flap endonuclease-1 [Nitrososphaerota archaeon]